MGKLEGHACTAPYRGLRLIFGIHIGNSVVKLALDVRTIQYHKNRKVRTEVPAMAKFVW